MWQLTLQLNLRLERAETDNCAVWQAQSLAPVRFNGLTIFDAQYDLNGHPHVPGFSPGNSKTGRLQCGLDIDRPAIHQIWEMLVGPLECLDDQSRLATLRYSHNHYPTLWFQYAETFGQDVWDLRSIEQFQRETHEQTID